MRINSIDYKTGLYKANNNIPKQKGLSFGSGFATIKDIENIISLIQKYDSSRMDGTVQNFYQYGDYMVKAPDKYSANIPLKEFFALARLKQAKLDGDIVPANATYSKVGRRNFLVEEYVQGEKTSFLPYSTKDASCDLKSIAKMDTTGIVNKNLSPSNIVIAPNKTRRILDFDVYSFLAEDGRVMHSEHTAPSYYLSKTPISKISDSGEINGDFLSKTKSIRKIFASSFTHKKRLPKDAQDLTYLRNMSQNPYINIPSNLTNYEGKTIYSRMINSDIKNPPKFIRDYLCAKSENYHRTMRDFLNDLKINDERLDIDPSRISTKDAEQQIKQAAEYEDLLCNLFKHKKPDSYFTKLEAAKIQLTGLLNYSAPNSKMTAEKHVPAAYQQLIEILEDGLRRYDEPEYQKYLSLELKKYREAFKNTGFGELQIKESIPQNLNILENYFGDINAKDIKYAVSDDELIEDAFDSVKKFIASPKNGMDKAEVSAKKLQIIRESIIDGIECSGESIEKVPEGKIEQLIQEASKKADAFNVKYSARRAKKLAADKASSAIRNAEYKIGNATDKVSNYAKKYTNDDYIKMGGKYFAWLGVFALMGAVALREVVRYKKEKRPDENAFQIVENKSGS